jgi:hypothetical protein
VVVCQAARLGLLLYEGTSRPWSARIDAGETAAQKVATAGVITSSELDPAGWTGKKEVDLLWEVDEAIPSPEWETRFAKQTWSFCTTTFMGHLDRAGPRNRVGDQEEPQFSQAG